MRGLLAIAVWAITLSFLSTPGRAGEDRGAIPEIPKASISSAAQTFVSLHHAFQDTQKPRLTFQDADILAQDTPGKWAVLGGYMAFVSGKDPQAHAYGLTMVQTCPRHDDPKCWQLEKLLIDKELVVDK